MFSAHLQSVVAAEGGRPWRSLDMGLGLGLGLVEGVALDQAEALDDDLGARTPSHPERQDSAALCRRCWYHCGSQSRSRCGSFASSRSAGDCGMLNRLHWSFVVDVVV